MADTTFVQKIARQYGCGPVDLAGNERAWFDRHLVFDHVVAPESATPREQFEAIACSVRDLLTQRWLKTQKTYEDANPKQVYYLSMEYLIGKSLGDNIINLQIEPLVRERMRGKGLDWQKLADEEPDAGLGNGGLGRLAACFIDSLATLQIPAIGYGLRYQYGMFRQDIEKGHQVEHPDNWLRYPNPWAVPRRSESVPVTLGCSFALSAGGSLQPIRNQPYTIDGIPHDQPVVGYGGHTINTLRLWEASPRDVFDFGEFSRGDFVEAMLDKLAAETITRVLYPDDSTRAGKALRFAQEYFLVACSLTDILDRFRRRGNDWHALPDKVAIQINDTHPSLAVAELMLQLREKAKLGWDDAWDLTCRTLAYTNHTLLPEALEKWPVSFFETILPRHLEILYEINRRFLDEVRARFPGDEGRVERMSLFDGDGDSKQVRMANLAIVGTHSTNGVAAIHSQLLRTRTVKDFADMYPERFNNKTNGVTPRRWLLLANPELSRHITQAIGDGWITDLSQLRRLAPLADDSSFQIGFRKASRALKVRFADWVKIATGQQIDPDTIFDSQVKRIHEYKRQLLNLLHILILYNRLRRDPKIDTPPRTFFFAGKAAPAYHFAKLVIKLINNVAAVIDNDPAVAGRLKVLFLPDYNVTLAERLIPASDVSEQISTAGYEASGTSNMKFMMNGALTVGTRDGATIEMAQEAGEENFFLFGLTAEEVLKNRSWYNPLWHYENEAETREALDLIFSDYFSRDERGIFAPIRDTLLTKGDFYMHLADLTPYVQIQERVGKLHGDRAAWSHKAILNIAYSGKFSSDRSIREYADEIWKAKPCPVE